MRISLGDTSFPPKITTPTLLIDKTRCLENIRRMSLKAKEANIRLRAHCKTHASLEIARWFRDELSSSSCGGVTITCIAVSSLSMAEYFAPEWKDIIVAFPVNILEIDTINTILLANNNGNNNLQLTLLVENTEAVEALESNLVMLGGGRVVGIYIKIDVGYGRTGIPL
jgi:D-serine deaminase-like pyridoxal phosphate-dependent protein